MTAPDTPPLPTFWANTAPQSLWRLLGRSFQCYRRWGWAFTRPVLGPVALKLGGFLYCALIPFYAIEAARPLIENGQVLAAVALTLLSPLPGLVLFCVGVWRYLLLMASLSANAAHVVADPETRPDFSAAIEAIEPKRYSRLLVFLLGLLWLPPLGLYGGTLVLTAAMPTVLLRIAALVLGLGLSLLTLGASILVAIACLPAFQVTALEPAHTRARDVIRRCFVLARNNMGRLTLAFIVWTLVTSLLAPALACALGDLLHLTALFMPPAEMFVGQMLAAYSPGQLATWGMADGVFAGLYDWLYGTMSASRAVMARNLAHLAMSAAVTLLTLPWGTFLFTLLYGDLCLRHVARSSRHPQPAPQAEQA